MIWTLDHRVTNLQGLDFDKSVDCAVQFNYDYSQLFSYRRWAEVIFVGIHMHGPDVAER